MMEVGLKRNCESALSHLRNEKSRRVRTPAGIEHVGLLSDEPPAQAGLLFISSSEDRTIHAIK